MAAVILAEFLAARLDEDEAAAGAGARRVGMPWCAELQPGTPGGLVIDDDLGLVASTGGGYAAEHIARHDPARVLRRVEAGRQILRRCSAVMDELDVYPNGLVSPRAFLARMTLRYLAVEYDGHPDYDEAWRP